MLGEKRPEFNNSESSQKTEKQIQEQRRRESIAAMAREERKKRIAQQLEKASKKAEEPAPSEDRKSEKRVPKRMFSQIAEAMLQQRRETGPVQEQEIAELELAIKEINRVVNASELSKEKRIKVIVDHLRGRKLAEESLVAVLQSLDGSDSSIPKEQANEILRAIIKQNKEAYQTVLDSLEDPEEKNAVQKGTEKKPEPKPALGVEVEAFTQQRTKRAERVANHRQLTQIEERIKSLKAKDQRTLTTAEKEELEDLEKQKQELLLKQFENIEGSHFIDYQGNQQETTIANYLLDLDKLEALIETGDNIPEMIPSEAEKFNTIKSFLKKPEVQSQLQALREATDTATKQQLLQDSENLIKLLEQISNPLIAGRIELNAKRKESASTISKEMDYSRLSDLAEEFAQYEDWKRNAPVEDRIAAAREDFMTKILLLNLEDFDETDLYLTLQEFNLGSVAVDRKGKIEWAINTSLERNHQAEVLNLIRTAEKIKKQHELAWQIVGYERDQDNEQLASQADFVDAVQSDLISIFNKVKQPEDTESLSDTRIAQETQSPKRLESETFLRDLYHKGIVSLEITPTGVTFVVNSYLIGETSEAAFKQLMRAVGQEEQLSKINETGLGLTLKEEALTNLQGHIKGEVVPSVSIIVLPEDPTQRNVEASIQLHETTDYLLESFDSQQINQLRQDHGFETIPEAIGRGLRELTSRINDGTLAENPQIHYFLDNLYITKDDKLSSQEQESIMRLVRIVESILRTKPPEFDENTQQLQDAVRRSQLAFDIRSKLRRLAVEHAQIENIVDKVTQELAKEYSINIPDVQRDTYFSSSPEVGDKGFHKYISYASATGGPAKKQSYIGISDSTNPLNKGLDEARGTAQFGGSPVPDWYGKPGEGAQNTRWEFADEGTGFIPASVLPGFRTLAKIPVVGTILDYAPIPVPNLRSYAVKRSLSARLARSFDPRLRKLSQIEIAHEDLGANPTKALLLISPELEHKVKKFAPGWLAAHKIGEERENLPVSMQLGIYDQLYQQGPQWLAQLGVGDGLIGSVDMQRYLGELLGTKYEFNGQVYQFAVDHKSLQNIDQFSPTELERVQEKLRKLTTRTTTGELRYKYDGPRYSPTEGIFSSAIKESLRRGASDKQTKVAKFFKSNARRSDLPSDTKNIFEWERQIGSEYRSYWQQRDGFMALQTLFDESQHFEHRDPDKPEKYSLFELTNLIHYGEEQLRKDSWLTNSTNTNLKLTINKRGKSETVTIKPGEFLRDAYGNLIPKGVKLQKSGEELVITGGHLQADMEDDTTRGLWGRLVGDYENPYLRFIRLNSQDAMDKAIDTFGTDADDGYDPQNVILRTDGINWAIHQTNLGIMNENLSKGLPPDRRYEMEGMDSTSSGERVFVIKFADQFTDNGGGTHDTFTRTGDPTPEDIATPEFIEYLKNISEYMKDKTKNGNYVNAYLKRELEGGGPITRRDISAIMEQVLRITGEGGGKNLSAEDSYFDAILNLKTYDASWYNPYRQEQNRIDPMDKEQAEYIMRTLDEGFNLTKKRFESGQDFLYQWQKAVVKIHQYERIAYTAMAHYRGLEKFVERATNLGMLASFLAMGLTGNPLAFSALLLSFGARYEFKPWATKQSKTWLAKRIKALQRIQEVESLDNIFAKAIEKGVPTDYELGRMFSKCEEIIFWMEDLAKTKPPDDWFPKDDRVLSTWESLVNLTTEKIKSFTR